MITVDRNIADTLRSSYLQLLLSVGFDPFSSHMQKLSSSPAAIEQFVRKLADRSY